MLRKLLSAFIIGFACTVLLVSQWSASAEQVKFEGYEIPVDIMVNGSYLEDSGKGFLDDNGIIYVPVRFVSEALGAYVRWDAILETAVVSRQLREYVFEPATQGCYVDNVWSYTSQRIINGVLYADAKFLLAKFGASYEYDSLRHEISLSLPDYTVPTQFLETYYTAEDLYWLAKIVTCEAGSVTFNQQVMVANVILNRRASSSFPNTIYEVIYDRRFGIQFSPAYSGRLPKANPNAKTYLACKAALNGLNLAPDCLYFIYASNKSGWIARTRPLYAIVGNQAYYK